MPVFANSFAQGFRWQLRGWVKTLHPWSALLSRILLFASRGEGDARGKSVPTEDLIQRFQSGQPRAFDALYDRFKDYVYRIAFFITRNSGAAEDAVQETFLDVMRALPNYRIDGPARFETWLYRVTVNRCRSMMRKRRPTSADWDEIEERLDAAPDSHASPTPEGVTLRRERAVELWRAVDELPEKQRIVVLLRYQQGFSYEEIAETLNVKMGTVKSRLYYAHRKLKGLLQQAKV